MDRELSQDVVKRAKLKRYSRLVIVIAIPVIGLLLIRAMLKPELHRSRILTSIAETGPLEATVSASGTVIPGFEQVITSPIASRVNRVFLKTGDRADSGQSILELDMESIKRTLDQSQDELRLHENEKERLSLELNRSQIDFQSRYDIKELQTRYARSERERISHLTEIGGATRVDLDQADLNVEINERELQQLANQLENQQATLKADLKSLDIKINIQKNKIDEVRRQINRAETRAERPGVVTWVNDNIGSSVSAGEVVARIADLSSFRIEAQISDVHAASLKAGGTVRVRIKDSILTGSISVIQPAVKDGVITFLVALDDSSNPLLRSNLRVDVYVVTAMKPAVTRVKNGAFYAGIVDQKVFVIKGDKAIRKTVKIGEVNFDWVEVIGDIHPGDEVIISNMKDFEHVNEVEVEPD